MIKVMVYVIIAVFGLALGSFVNAFAWRVSKQSKLTSAKKRRKYSIAHGRSMCPYCEHELSATELIPVISWLVQGGRCRHCKKSISIQYPFVELVFCISLVVSYVYWPLNLSSVVEWLLFAIWAGLLVVGFTLAIIDIRSQLLPTHLVYAFGGLSIVFVFVQFVIDSNVASLYSSMFGAVLLGGLFYLVYQVSAGRWIGGGDVRLLAVMGILLGWQKGVLALLLGCYLASAVILILFFAGKYHKKMRIAFGPFLLTATYGALLFGQNFVDFYKRLSGL